MSVLGYALVRVRYTLPANTQLFLNPKIMLNVEKKDILLILGVQLHSWPQNSVKNST